MTSSDAWWKQRLLLSDKVSALSIGPETALFSEHKQRLFKLNSSAFVIWRGVSAGLSCAEISSHLTTDSTSGKDAEDYVRLAVAEWISLGFLTPSNVVAAMEMAPSASMIVRLGDFVAELKFFGDASPDCADTVFGHLRQRDPSASIPRHEATIAIIGVGDEEYVFKRDVAVGVGRRDQTAPKIKGVLTEEYCRWLPGGFLTHGALVSVADKTVFLSGAPGAGKTTLTLALCANGFAYGGDDIVHIDENGNALGVPFSAAAKSGAWPLLRDYVPRLDSLTIHERPDRQLARYVLPAVLDRRGHRPMNTVLFLAREQGVGARLEPMSPLDALCAILEGGYSSTQRLTAQTTDGLAKNLTNATCARLVYDDLASAVALIRTAVHE